MLTINDYHLRLACIKTLHIVIQSVSDVTLCVIVEDNAPGNITRLKSVLANIIEPDFGLLDQLLGRDVLTRRQYDDIRSERRAAYRRSEAVLDMLVSEDQCDKFVKVLQRTSQQHVVNFITQNGGQSLVMYQLTLTDSSLSIQRCGLK